MITIINYNTSIEYRIYLGVTITLKATIEITLCHPRRAPKNELRKTRSVMENDGLRIVSISSQDLCVCVNCYLSYIVVVYNY